MSIKVDAKKLQQALARLVPAFNERAAGLLRAEGETLLAKAQETVPVKSGILKASAVVAESQTGRGPKVTVSYTASYAAAVHERSANEEHHKWFEKAFNQFEHEFQQRMVAELQSLLADAVKDAK